MTRSTDPEMNAALEADAEKVRAMGGDPGPELEDFDFDDGPDGIGCYNCNNGWRHGCMDDMCRSCNEAQDCDDAQPCGTCNPKAEWCW